MKRIVSHHASVAVVSDSYRELLLVTEYDQTYPNESQRGKIGLVGGNRSPPDLSPLETLTREIEEEFNQVFDDGHEFAATDFTGYTKGTGKILIDYADQNLMTETKNQILHNITSYQDLVINTPMKNGDFKDVLMSIYQSKIPEELLHRLLKEITQKKQIRSEGLTKIITHNDLLSGKVSCSFGIGAIFNYFFNESIPHRQDKGFVNVGQPRKSYKDYTEFIYENHP